MNPIQLEEDNNPGSSSETKLDVTVHENSAQSGDNLNGSTPQRQRPNSLDLSLKPTPKMHSSRARRGFTFKRKSDKVPSKSNIEDLGQQHECTSEHRTKRNFSLLSNFRTKRSVEEGLSSQKLSETQNGSNSIRVKLASFKKHSPKVITNFLVVNETEEKLEPIPLQDLRINGTQLEMNNKQTGQTKAGPTTCDRHRKVEKRSIAVSTCSCLKENGVICHHHNTNNITMLPNGNSFQGRKDAAVGTSDNDLKFESSEELRHSKLFGDDLYLHAIVCIVILLVVLAVGSAMMSSIQKILQNRAMNRVNPFESPQLENPTVGSTQIDEKLPYPKDLGTYLYDYIHEKEKSHRVKTGKKQKKISESKVTRDSNASKRKLGADKDETQKRLDQSFLLRKLLTAMSL